ncbi:hypothetical protein LLS1_04790 [Leifsonia sp. LS1]|uniref:GNAT family N-acetyltransferase n=1 Tax=Leifsonia sp. LS1 TaxID=2828483 RepID=UPI001CFEE295|nr:GNAT family N-acetyltransferase [Leifsonia sp. LS1]GIT78810.1 hypothetical protein LLS1_04790 [Leifsonia sp. LS1]
MPTEIRIFDPALDADAVAAFFNAQKYGPVDRGFPLTAEALLRIVRERDVRLLMIAEQAGRIVGTVGYARVSGRRASREDELFAGMFLIAPSHRSGFLAGQLFTESFSHLIAAGVRSLRVEVDPANKKAFPLYVRVGFRAIDGMRPDEDGYVELVSVLPGVVADLLDAFAEHDGVEKVLPKLDWRTLAASRQGLHNGVRREDSCRIFVDYEFRIGKMRAEVVADAQNARTVLVKIDGVTDPRFQGQGTVETHSAAEEPSEVLAFRGFTLEINRWGTITLRHPRHLGPLFVVPFPVDASAPLGMRRPVEMAVTTTSLDGGWISENDGARREVRLVDGAIRFRSVLLGAAPLRESPRPGLRVAEIHQNRPGSSERGGHLIRGIWPVDLTDFEGVGDAVTVSELAEADLEWIDQGIGLRMRLAGHDDGMVRVEGPGLLVTAARTELSYTLMPDVLPPNASPLTPASTDIPLAWRESRRGGAAVVVGSDAAGQVSIVIAPDHGLVQWMYCGVQIIDSAFPSARVFGPLAGVSAAVWVSLLGDRSHIDRGAEWALADERVPFTTSRKDGWTAVPLDDGSLALVVRAPEIASEPETAVFLVAPGRPATVRIEEASGKWVDLPCDGRSWRTWTRRLRIPLPGGATLGVSPLEGENAEILVRSTPGGVICTMLTTTPSGGGRSVWRLDHDAGIST